MTADMTHPLRELHVRDSAGIVVRLLWDERDGRVTVSVEDRRTGTAFTVEVRDGDRALDVFDQPFAYAAQRRVAGSAVAPRVGTARSMRWRRFAATDTGAPSVGDLRTPPSRARRRRAARVNVFVSTHESGATADSQRLRSRRTSRSTSSSLMGRRA